MLDFFNLPTNLGNADVQVFSGRNEDRYRVPRGKTMLFIYAVGAGGGGGGGLTGISGSQRGGGGWGGSGAVGTLLVPIFRLPDLLTIHTPLGGQGGGSGVAGGSGIPSGIYWGNSGAAEPTNLIMRTSNGNANGGGAGTNVAGGAGGVAVSAQTIGNMPMAGLGLYNLFAGQAGTAGGNNTVGGAIALPVTGINVMGGTGGGGIINAAGGVAGGLITGVTSSYVSDSRPINAAGGSNNGSGSFLPDKLFFNYSGMGGGASNAGVGGNGGNGGYGSGGGGGGGGTTGGKGGNGGSGLVVMIAW